MNKLFNLALLICALILVCVGLVVLVAPSEADSELTPRAWLPAIVHGATPAPTATATPTATWQPPPSPSP